MFLSKVSISSYSISCLFCYILTITLLCCRVGSGAERSSIGDLLRLADLAHQKRDTGSSAPAGDSLFESFTDAKDIRPDQLRYDVTYYRFALTFDRENAQIRGKVTMTADAVETLDECVLDSYWMLLIDSVKVNGRPTNFSWGGFFLKVDLGRSYQRGEKFTLQTFYHGFESALNGWSLLFNSYDGKPVLGNVTRLHRARAWWPCKDDPSDKADSLDFFATYPSNQFCSSNGRLVSDTDNLEGMRTTHWSVRYPIATYCVGFAMAEFSHWREWAHPDEADSVPVDFWVYPSRVAAVQRAFAGLVPAIELFTRLFGPYPFAREKFAVSNVVYKESMEHQTNVLVPPSLDTNVIAVVHELAHQWWGNMISARDWHQIWLNEGFASYSEALYVEDSLGREAYHSYMNRFRYVGAQTVYRPDTDGDSLLHIVAPTKGAWILHMLRKAVGDSVFFAGLRAYGQSSHRYGTAVTEDFAQVMSRVADRDLGPFFNQWVYARYYPDYTYRWRCLPNGSGTYHVDLTVEQSPTQQVYFSNPVEFRFTTTNGTTDSLRLNDYGFVYHTFEFSDSVIQIDFDPDNWILKEVAEQPFRLAIKDHLLPRMKLETPFSVTLEAVGGVPPYSWSYGGDLPIGVEFASDQQAVLAGTPTFPAEFYFTLRVTDSATPPDMSEVDFVVDLSHDLRPGDCNGDSRIDVLDVVYLINFIFAGGSSPLELEVGDVNHDGRVNISDAVFLIQFLFAGGVAPM